MKKLITLLTALILLFASASLAEEAFRTDEAGHPVFTNLEEANQHSTGSMLRSDCNIIIVAKDNTYYRIKRHIPLILIYIFMVIHLM